MDANEEEVVTKPEEEKKEGEEDKPVEKKQKTRKRPVFNNVKCLMEAGPSDSMSPTQDQTFEAVPTVTDTTDIHAKCKAIIQSFCAVEANYALEAARYRKDSPP